MLRITQSRLTAVLMCLLAAGSSGFVFWFSVAETYPLGSLTLLIAIYFAFPAEAVRSRPNWQWVAMAAGTLAVTITNFAIGCMGLLAAFRFRKAAQLGIVALLVVLFLASVQRFMIPSSSFFFSRHLTEESRYVQPRDDGGPAVKIGHILLSSVVLPPVEVTSRPGMVSRASVQRGLFSDRSLVSILAVAAWLFLLVGGLYGLWLSKNRSFKWFVLGALGFQISLHTLYGEETFLFAAHSLPILLTVAAYNNRWMPKNLTAGVLAIFSVIIAWANNEAFLSLVKQL
jgi:hypothetical protein